MIAPFCCQTPSLTRILRSVQSDCRFPWRNATFDLAPALCCPSHDPSEHSRDTHCHTWQREQCRIVSSFASPAHHHYVPGSLSPGLAMGGSYRRRRNSDLHTASSRGAPASSPPQGTLRRAHGSRVCHNMSISAASQESVVGLQTPRP